MAPIKRVNSVAVSTANFTAEGKRLQQDDFARMLVNCGYEPDNIVGIQYLPHRQIVVVKFKTSEHYANFLDINTVRVNGVPCKIYDMSSSYTLVTVLGAPFEMDKEDISAILGRYGQVLSIRPRMLACSKVRQFNVLPDGTWLVSMNVKDPIPSYLIVNDVQIVIHYYGQAKTCRLCGSTGHLARDCKPQDPLDLPADPLAFPALTDAHPRPEPLSTGVAAHFTINETDTQESCATDDEQQTEIIDNGNSIQEATYPKNNTDDSREDTHNTEPPSVNIPIPVIKIRTASASKAAAAPIEKIQKTKLKAKRAPNAAGAPALTTDSNSKMNLRPIKKRQTTHGTSESRTDGGGKGKDPPKANYDQFIDLDRNDVVTVNVPEQTAKEN